VKTKPFCFGETAFVMLQKDGKTDLQQLTKSVG